MWLSVVLLVACTDAPWLPCEEERQAVGMSEPTSAGTGDALAALLTQYPEVVDARGTRYQLALQATGDPTLLIRQAATDDPGEGELDCPHSLELPIVGRLEQIDGPVVVSGTGTIQSHPMPGYRMAFLTGSLDQAVLPEGRLDPKQHENTTAVLMMDWGAFGLDGVAGWLGDEPDEGDEEGDEGVGEFPVSFSSP